MVDLERQLGRPALFLVNQSVPRNDAKLERAVRRRWSTSMYTHKR